jgi:hypothetical protein
LYVTHEGDSFQTGNAVFMGNRLHAFLTARIQTPILTYE